VANFSVDELISWPADTVLLLDLGIVPMLIPTSQQTRERNLLEQVVAPLTDSSPPKRSNVLMLIGLQTDVGTTNYADVTTWPANQTPPNAESSDGLAITYEPEPSSATEAVPQPSPSIVGSPLYNQLPPANPVMSGQ
jgi:hypothetical protein